MSGIYPFSQIYSQMSGPSTSRATSRVTEESDTHMRGQDVTALDGTRLIPVTELPQRYRSVFINRFPHFNVVQSKVFEEVFQTNKSIVLSAPTSSGKTVVFELAVIKGIKDLEEKNESVNCLKCVYMAPLKKLVDEKYSEFRNSFERFGLNCVQFTGDSEMDDYEKLSIVNIVFTTPEKWDSMIRSNQNSSLIRSVQLMLIDEIHSISDDQRGATMEAVISRMKTLRSVQMKTSGASKIRFIAASATAPNVGDIAHWLDPNDSIGVNLSEEYRPVRIQVLVMGYNCAKDVTDFKFDINLNYRLDSVIRSHSDSKPTLIFCSTRKSVEMTAKILSNSKNNYFNSFTQRTKLEASLKRRDFEIKDKNLLSYLKCGGIGYHHSGLDKKDKQVVERLFIDSQIPILISTTTLSMGVNLPAHLVIIKNTTQFESNGVVREYPETLIMQMIGRAGRPQFDTSAIAVIMTKNEKRMKYELLSNGNSIIESKLHSHLIEHLNAEISLRTVTSIDIAVDWIRSTFLYIRLLQNPSFYQKSIQIANIEQGLQVGREWCQKELMELKQSEMIATDDSFSVISSTGLGRFMARHCISFETMKKFSQMIEKDLEMKDIISEIVKCNEMTQEIQIRVSDKKVLNDLNQNSIRFPIDGKIKSSEMKINCLIQTTFGSQTSKIPENTLIQESMRIVRTGQRLSQCLSDILVFKSQQNITKISFKNLLNSIILSKCFKAKLWPDSRLLTKQFQRIGDKISEKISQKYKTFQQLRGADPREVEYSAERRSPFGTQVIDWVKRLPYYSITITQNMKDGLKAKKASVILTVKLENFKELNEKNPLYKSHSCFLLLGDESNRLFCCQQLFDTKLLKNNGFYSTKDIVIERNDRSDYISAHLISDSLVGLDVECKLKVVFAADTRVTPELIGTNTQPNSSTAFSDVRSCEPNSKSDSSQRTGSTDRCQHKCSNKKTCLHNCCKKGLNSDKIPETQNKKTKNKRQSNGEQSSAKKKQNKSEEHKTQTNLNEWLKKYPKTVVKAEPRVETESQYFSQMYSEIKDNQNEQNFNEMNDSFELKLEEQNIEFKTDDKMDVSDDGFSDEELDKLIEEHFDELVAEDFQDFCHKSNDIKPTENQTEIERPKVRLVTMEDMKDICSQWSLENQWSLFVPTTQLEGKTMLTNIFK